MMKFLSLNFKKQYQVVHENSSSGSGSGLTGLCSWLGWFVFIRIKITLETIFGVNTVLQHLLHFFCSLDGILENSVLCWPVGVTRMYCLLRKTNSKHSFVF